MCTYFKCHTPSASLKDDRCRIPKVLLKDSKPPSSFTVDVLMHIEEGDQWTRS